MAHDGSPRRSWLSANDPTHGGRSDASFASVEGARRSARACARPLRNVENWIARVIALALGLIGVAFLAVFPLMQTKAARERADIDRALAPLLSVPLEQLQVPGGRTFDVRIPNDDQWNRVAKRLGSPSFLLVAASAMGETRQQMFPPPDVGLSPRVWRNGTEVALVTTSDTPEGYSVRAATNSSKFKASPADRISISARIGPATVPAGSVFLLVPQWSAASASAWGEGAAIDSAIGWLLGLASVLAGVVFVLWALTIAWGRPDLA
jgi:hypothetical protein